MLNNAIRPILNWDQPLEDVWYVLQMSIPQVQTMIFDWICERFHRISRDARIQLKAKLSSSDNIFKDLPGYNALFVKLNDPINAAPYSLFNQAHSGWCERCSRMLWCQGTSALLRCLIIHSAIVPKQSLQNIVQIYFSVYTKTVTGSFWAQIQWNKASYIAAMIIPVEIGYSKNAENFVISLMCHLPYSSQCIGEGSVCSWYRRWEL